MRPLLALALLIATQAPQLQAQRRNFDIFNFTPPPGWTLQQDGDHLTATHIDQASRTFAMAGLYASRPAAPDPAADFASEWKSIVQQSFSAGATPRATSAATPSGLRYVEGSASVRQQTGAPAWVRLMTFFANGRAFSLMFVATDQAALAARGPAIRALTDSLQVSGGAAAPRPSPPPSTAPASGNGIAGVWMGFRAAGLGSYEPRPRWYTFFEDGRVYEDIPLRGFYGWDPRASQNDTNDRPYWGTYSFANSAGVINKPGARFTTSIKLQSDGSILLDSDKFIRCRPVDGLRLDGAWTSYANPNDPAIDRLPAGQRPVIHLSRDGRFQDEGLFATFLRDYSDPRPEGGTGAYEVREFSLLLRYADGRVRQLALTGFLQLDPAADSKLLFLRRSQFNRRR